jgi:hypothetical protein
MADSTEREHMRSVLRGTEDDAIRGPLWEWAPAWRLAVIHERRRRFGWDDEGMNNG